MRQLHRRARSGLEPAGQPHAIHGRGVHRDLPERERRVQQGGALRRVPRGGDDVGPGRARLAAVHVG